jgi:hypothetical protein
MPHCTHAFVREYPDVIDWHFDDGTVETTTNESVETIAGRLSIAARAEKLGLGRKADLFEYLGGRRGVIERCGALFGPVPETP